uniref:Uncharacterized protein n=1 Tax=Eptatretus burgeri TaxID=7764 RepID=A0A8C4WYW5_EPTBU
MIAAEVSKSKRSSYVVEFDRDVHVLEFSPFVQSSSLLAVTSDTSVTVCTCVLQKGEEQADGLVFDRLQVFEQLSRVCCLAWSPESHLGPHPQLINSHLANFSSTFSVRELIFGHDDWKLGMESLEQRQQEKPRLPRFGGEEAMPQGQRSQRIRKRGGPKAQSVYLARGLRREQIKQGRVHV